MLLVLLTLLLSVLSCSEKEPAWLSYHKATAGQAGQGGGGIIEEDDDPVPDPQPDPDPEPDPDPDPDPEPDPQPDPDPEPGPGPTYPAWDAATVYLGGDFVTYNGHIYKAQWWTKGDNPETQGEWGPWKIQ